MPNIITTRCALGDDILLHPRQAGRRSVATDAGIDHLQTGLRIGPLNGQPEHVAPGSLAAGVVVGPCDAVSKADDAGPAPRGQGAFKDWHRPSARFQHRQSMRRCHYEQNANGEDRGIKKLQGENAAQCSRSASLPGSGGVSRNRLSFFANSGTRNSSRPFACWCHTLLTFPRNISS